jgi:hypothetical protein
MDQSEHISDKEAGRYWQRQMSSEELLALNEHIIVCDVCRLRLSERKRLSQTISSLRSELQTDSVKPPHQPLDRLSAYAHGELSGIDCEVVENHLEECEACTNHVDSLRASRISPGAAETE